MAKLWNNLRNELMEEKEEKIEKEKIMGKIKKKLLESNEETLKNFPIQSNSPHKTPQEVKNSLSSVFNEMNNLSHSFQSFESFRLKKQNQDSLSISSLQERVLFI